MHCVRNAPIPARTTGQALWPRVEPTDYCGDFRPVGRGRHASLVASRSELAEGASREAALVKRETADPTDDQSRRDAASANNQSSIIHNQSPALPVYVDAFGEYCQIPLTQNRFAKVDPEDYVWLSQFRWCCKANRDTCYAIRHIQEHGRTKRIHMHRQIMNTPNEMICDHKNHNGLDNRRLNLRNCTIEQNNANRRSSPHATSEFIGVSYCRKRDKWVSSIKHHGRAKNLGQFDRPEDAARAHDKAAWETWGEYANLNFPDEYPSHPAARARGGP
ncbi:MAG: AP2 domain-containing protein [Phycisphaerales bacterium]|jgi:hypothetical protein